MPYDERVVHTVAPPGALVEDGERALARLLGLQPPTDAGAGPVVARAMLVAVVGLLIALTLLAVDGLL